ncbi:DUF2911 domain-containing protein [Persicitalea jodogahamensis]|uniref:DUF2911 domain-containing protein n=1 Tax=Persicitalea jodogahamensis TaxID=402147 RepID=A0A8J3D172_9BACT|nr:DUF2911 domain-containing protein [Persicitalea jodogahamensis]GHB52935.1 hypothetical protein GCM10007390_02010 [Persicitalea jodogahamensis]
MKKTLLIFSLVVFAFSTVFAQKPSPKMTADGKNVTVVYGQPSKRDRVIFGKEGSGSLEPYGKVWRTGANEATEITFKKDVMFGGKPVKAGTYSLYSIPGEKEWTVILNPELKQWGAFGYDKVKDKNVAEVTVPTKNYKTSADKLMFDVKDDNKLSFQWDKQGFEVPLKYQK